MNASQQQLLQSYAAGHVSWHDLQRLGFDDYVAVLGGLGSLGLRPPIAPIDGPNAAALTRGVARIEQLLAASKQR